MPSTTPAMSDAIVRCCEKRRALRALVAVGLAATAAALSVGCANLHNQWREDGPASRSNLTTPTVDDVIAHAPQAPQRTRACPVCSITPQRGAVPHYPLYFEDPFADKGHGRTGSNAYYVGWEDYVAMPYSFARYHLNYLMIPVSFFVTPPCYQMESDGALSRQLLGYDHDAQKAPGGTTWDGPASTATVPTRTTVGAPPVNGPAAGPAPSGANTPPVTQPGTLTPVPATP